MRPPEVVVQAVEKPDVAVWPAASLPNQEYLITLSERLELSPIWSVTLTVEFPYRLSALKTPLELTDPVPEVSRNVNGEIPPDIVSCTE